MGITLGFYYIQISVFILGTLQNLQPEYSVRVFNTENIILSLEDFDLEANDDLEIIKSTSNSPELDHKLRKFHRYVKTVKAPEKSREKFDYELNNFITYVPDISYPDSLFEIAMDEKHLSMLERRSKKSRARWRKKRKKMMQHLLFKKFLEMNKWGIEKRQLTTIKAIESVDEFEDLEKDYQDYVARSKQNNTAFKYTDEGKPEESFKDALKKIKDVNIPKNCTNVTGVGVQAIECIMKNIKEKDVDKKDLLNKISIIMLVWFCIYLAIAIPLWCAKGWCCCCFRCAFCFPNRTVREIQKYVAENPPGVCINSDGEEEHYNASRRETELYEKLKRSIADF